MKTSSYTCLIVSIFVFLSISSAASYNSVDFDAFLQCLPKHSDVSTVGAILTPNNASFQSIYQLRANNLRILSSATSRPVAIITALHPSHAQAAVICAKRHGIHLRIRSGGHDYEGLSYITDVPFVILDMFNLKSIAIDMKTETAWIQAGATIGELYYSIAKKSKVHGFHMVNGRILNRKSMGEDVFWAIRGGGTTSFGIILSWRIKLVRVPPRVTVFTVQRTLEQGATELAYRWQQVAPKLPKDLFIRLQPVPINNGGNNKTVRVSFIGHPTTLTGHFLGQADGLLRLMNVRFSELGLTRNDCLEMSWVKSALYWAGFPNGTSIDVLLDRVQVDSVLQDQVRLLQSSDPEARVRDLMASVDGH
ncbi:hypothetical protein J1N35_039548 [Gossypium stocksii]|uniref:FAD-binding PCMH-type domain-containing protein n=1 Tax=Gossypium stocksii TaxID=47602 RepID=A0A9D3UQW8_9ROSI|nr:hypothetical protein J1N35_039548 [Gossypium stocksii]